jgi:branched-chain amino acid transport system ATP-binding protein
LGTAQDARSQTLPLMPAPSAEVMPVEYGDMGILRKSWADLRRTLKEASQWNMLRHTPYGLKPAAIFAMVGIIGGFDATVFGLVAPEIVRDLNLNVVSVIIAVDLVGFFLIFASIGVAFYLDRSRRLPWAGGGTIANGITSVLTPTAKSVGPIVAYRVFDNIGAEAAGLPGFSLITDYYPVDSRGRAFAVTGTLQRVGTLFAPWMVGLLAFNYGWRTPFYITGPLLIAAGIVMLVVLREPVRGYMERRAMGLDESVAIEEEPPVSFGQAWRTVWGIRTLRRLFMSNIVSATGSQIFGLTFGFYLFQHYHLNVLTRGKISTLSGVGALIGGFLGGGVVDSLMRRRPQRVLVYTGALGAAEAISLAGIALGPPVWLVVFLFAVFGFAFALTGPARGVFYGQVLPAHVRTLGGAIFGLAAIPGLVLAAVFLARIPTWGFQGVLFAATPFLFLSGLVDMSAAGFFERDMRNAHASQTATAEYRRSKEAGTLRLLVGRDIEVEYDGVQVLFGVDFDVDEGEIVALLGTNGAGKSTLLKAISGIQEASGGAILYDGREITHVPPYEIAARGIAHAPGGRGIFGSLTVHDNLELGKWLHDREPPDAVLDGEKSPLADIDIDEVLEIFPALRERMDTRGSALSGGEQQMVSLAQAFLARPRLLLIDELSLGLSPAVVQELLECVRRIHERGVTIVVVEQSVNIALTLAKRAVFMEKGEVKFMGPTADLLRRPDILRAVYVKGTGALGGGQTDARRERQRRLQGLEQARAVLEVEHLSKSFGGVTAVDDVSFALRDGEVLGLIGPNGAGKTTIFDLISGFQTPDAGRVVYDGNDVTSMGPDERARLQLIRRFQEARLFPSLTVYETILVALDRRHEAKNMIFTALQLPQARQSERRLRRRADQLIDLLELGAFRDKFIKELSTGLRRITDIACMLATEPKVLLLDEPSSGIAQAEAESLGPLLRRVRVETGCSILIIEHDMPLISRVADELLALDQGHVLLRGAPDTVLNDKAVIESYLGTSENAIRRSGALT